MIIIGMGRVGRGLKDRSEDHGSVVQSISREEGWGHIEPGGAGPILVCVNAGDLVSVINRVPEPRRSDLAFIQNGMLDTFLVERGCAGNTRGLLYFAVPSRGAAVRPGGESIFTGEHAPAIVEWFHRLGLDANVVSQLEFRNQMASKLIWNCTFGLLCDVYDESVDAVVEKHGDEIGLLVSELAQISNIAIGTSLEAADTTQDLCTYSNSIRGYRATLKQWEWRNGWFVEAARKAGNPAGRHVELLQVREELLKQGGAPLGDPS